MRDWILPLLRCPSDGDGLSYREGKLHSGAQSYPLLKGVPWLFPRPGMALLEWGTKIQNYVQEETQHIEFIQRANRTVKSVLTRKRLESQRSARQHNLEYLKSTLHTFLS